MWESSRVCLWHAKSTSVTGILLLVGIYAAAIVGCGKHDGSAARQDATASPVAPASSPAQPTSAGASAVAAEDSDSPAAKPAAPTADPPRVLTDEQITAGWIALFDGQTLFGWEHGQQADWHVEDGTIVVSQGPPGLLTTTTPFGDYELHVEFKADEGTNSGVFLATDKEPGDITTKCYELNIAGGDHPFPTGSLVNRQAAAAGLGRTDWQAFDVTVQAGHIVIRLDDQPVLDYTDPQPVRRGRVGLQLNQGKVAFRNVRLRPLGLESLFNGKDLTGWKSYPDMPSKFTVTAAGELHVENGSGQLETERSFGDFVLQLECMTHAPNLNSGLFFRCIPGEKMNGYESQIHNGYRDGDRNQPLDCGTGGIFRRQNARRVVGDDLAWVHKTIIAVGPHVSVWVNGYQVTDWTDTRAADPNPRKGLRVEPGTLMIQGHDATTNLSFRNLRGGELP